MYSEITSQCGPCQKNQPSLKSPMIPLQPLPAITKVRYRVKMDLTGPLIESEGYKYILTFIDHAHLEHRKQMRLQKAFSLSTVGKVPLYRFLLVMVRNLPA